VATVPAKAFLWHVNARYKFTMAGPVAVPIRRDKCITLPTDHLELLSPPFFNAAPDLIVRRLHEETRKFLPTIGFSQVARVSIIDQSLKGRVGGGNSNLRVTRATGAYGLALREPCHHGSSSLGHQKGRKGKNIKRSRSKT
jgi:hypothetical protein